LAVKRLLVPLATRFSPACFDMPLLRLAHDRLAEALRPIPGSTDDLVYLSRRHVPGRPQRPAMTNHDALDGVMRDLGFSVLCPESLSLMDQAAIMARARVVVGEDGSALHNVFLCRNPETHLLSICPSGRMNFFHIPFLARPGGTLHMCFDGIDNGACAFNIGPIASAVRAVLGHSP
jgi:capsular polysaccharide biosynthesis protein